MNTINKEGVIYTRVSSLKQVTQGSGLDSQYSACLNYAKENNIKIIKTSSSGGLVELRGIEPRTSWMPFKRSPSWAIAPSCRKLL